MIQLWATGGLVILALVVGLWLISLRLTDASIVDMFWGAGFVVLAWVYVGLTPEPSARTWLVVTLVSLWGSRLSLYLTWRNWGEGEDYRYAAMRKDAEGRFPIRSLVTVFGFQGLLITLLSVAHLVAIRNAAPLGVADAIGCALFAVGLVFETVGDLQLTSFRKREHAQGAVLSEGLWRYTRHPNYFGDACVWWGFGVLVLARPTDAWALLAPLVMTFLLLKVSGVALLEKKLVQKREGYRDYVRRTNAFFPWWPRA